MPMSRQQISGAVKVALESIGEDARHYSGISMCRGGITAAVQSKASEPILYLQSGHGTAMAGRRYVDPVDPRILYDTVAVLFAPWTVEAGAKLTDALSSRSWGQELCICGENIIGRRVLLPAQRLGGARGAAEEVGWREGSVPRANQPEGGLLQVSVAVRRG